jgi:hypothetical protein
MNVHYEERATTLLLENTVLSINEIANSWAELWTSLAPLSNSCVRDAWSCSNTGKMSMLRPTEALATNV